MWTCPHCDRAFGRARQSHVCLGAMPVEARLADFVEPQRLAAQAVLAIARRARGVVIEAVGVGILIKRERTLVELRPKTKWLDLSFIVGRAIASDRIARTLEMPRGYLYYVHLRDGADVDREVRGFVRASLSAA